MRHAWLVVLVVAWPCVVSSGRLSPLHQLAGVVYEGDTGSLEHRLESAALDTAGTSSNERVGRDDLEIDQHIDETAAENEDEYEYEEAEAMDSSSYPEVTIEGLGTARGTVMTSLDGRPFYAFQSIPYAQPPVNKLRFQYPRPYKGEWPTNSDGVYDATYLKSRCPQISLVFNLTAGREDCLHLSVYTPQLTPAKPLATMVWIHGGAYMTGDAFLYVPTKLMDKDVVVVTLQYRLGLFGFLGGDIKENPGNMGLMDQVMALRWVQDHVRAFGGDPDSVTVFGQSAGGASTSWMAITPLTSASAPSNNGRQLLHRAIPQSGSALEEWTLDSNTEEHFWMSASYLNCNESTTKAEAVKCMRGKSMEEVNWASIKIYADDRYAGGMGFKGLCPIQQTNLASLNDASIEVVIPRSPVDMVAAGEFLKVPLMMGSVRDEGSLVMGLSYKDYMLPHGYYTNDTAFLRDQAIPTILNAFGIPDKTGGVTNTMKLTFLPNHDVTDFNTSIGGLIDMAGMLFLKSGLWQLAHHVTAADPSVPVYFYSWEVEKDDSLYPWIFISITGENPVPGGISHADELIYLFHLPGELDDAQRVISRRMLTLWTNFAKYGNPTPDTVEAGEEWAGEVDQWLPFSADKPYFMLMTDDFVLDQDFVTRWNYHLQDGEVTTQSPTDAGTMVSEEQYEHEAALRQQYQMATAVVGGVAGVFLFIIAVLFVRIRKMK